VPVVRPHGRSGRLAQLVRASPLQGEGRGFESLSAHRGTCGSASASVREAVSPRGLVGSRAVRATPSGRPSTRSYPSRAMDRPELLAFAEDPTAYVAIGPDEERISTDGAVVTFEAGDHFWSTTVGRVRFADREVATELNDLRSLMRSRGRHAAAWSIGPSATPDDVVRRLLGLGLARESATPSSILVLTEQPDVRPSGFEVRRVRTFEDHVAAITVANEAFSFSAHDADDELRRAHETFEAERAGRHTARLLALDRGRPVAAGRAWFAPQGVYLGGGATIPSHRRRGAMGSLVAAAWETAVRRGTPALVALGGDMSTSPLRRVGFRCIGTIERLIDRFDDHG
jgi:acetyltransferase (GNAT) family protein